MQGFEALTYMIVPVFYATNGNARRPSFRRELLVFSHTVLKRVFTVEYLLRTGLGELLICRSWLSLNPSFRFSLSEMESRSAFVRLLILTTQWDSVFTFWCLKRNQGREHQSQQPRFNPLTSDITSTL